MLSEDQPAIVGLRSLRAPMPNVRSKLAPGSPFLVHGQAQSTACGPRLVYPLPLLRFFLAGNTSLLEGVVSPADHRRQMRHEFGL